jgi:hypothetical protein
VRSTILLVGARDDPHLQAVQDCLHSAPVVIDADSLSRTQFSVSEGGVQLRSRPGEAPVDLGSPWRGWLRRIAPPEWESGVTIGSHEAVVMSSWLSLLAAIVRHPHGTWLSTIDAMTSTENKLSQYITASALGITVPSTRTTNVVDCVGTIGGSLVAKPLGPTHFRHTDGRWLSVFTEPFDASSPQDVALLSGPPFLVQERLDAVAHLRVVTVRDRSWVCRLDASGLPLDWREEPRAHREWVASVKEPEVAANALRIAAEMGVGYSSQDWVVSADGRRVFLDLNPAGQWLFLPTPTGRAVTAAIADFLEEG